MKAVSKILAIIAIATLWLCVGCDVTLDDTTNDAPPQGLFVATTDYSVGGAAVVYGEPPVKVGQSDASISSDPAVRYYNEKIFVINRFGADNIQILDPNNKYKTIAQYSTGNKTNPQDVAFASGTKAFISLLADADLLVVKPGSGKLVDTIDLSAYADADGFPEAAKMLVIGNRLFVALQRVDSTNWYAPTDRSLIAVIDTATYDVVSSVKLETTDPVTDLIYDASRSKIYVGCSGGWRLSGYAGDDGGVESVSVNLTTDTYTADGVIFDEDDLGGDISAMAFASGTKAYAIVVDASFNNYLVKFDPTDPAGGVSTIWAPSSYIPAIAIDSNGYLFVADRNATKPGVRVWDTRTDTQITTDPLDVGLPPGAFAVME